jgi:hypothetical protein
MSAKQTATPDPGSQSLTLDTGADEVPRYFHGIRIRTAADRERMAADAAIAWERGRERLRQIRAELAARAAGEHNTSCAERKP